MPKLTGFVGRLAYAVLSGVVTFLVLWIIGAIVANYQSNIGVKIEDFSPLIGLLVGIWVFFAQPWVHPVA